MEKPDWLDKTTKDTEAKEELGFEVLITKKKDRTYCFWKTNFMICM